MYPQLARFSKMLLVAAAYFATGWFGLMMPAYGSSITLLWLPTGIAVAALFRCGYGCWVGVLFGAFAVNYSVGSNIALSLAIAIGNTLAPLYTVWLLRRIGFSPLFERRLDIVYLFAAASVGSCVSAGFGIASLSYFGSISDGFLKAGVIWWAGDTLGVINAAPLLLVFATKDLPTKFIKYFEFVLLALAIGIAGWAVFILNDDTNGQALSLAFFPLPLVAWAALRFGTFGTSFALITLSSVATYGTATGTGPFYRPNPIENMAMVWLFMATSAMLGWLISTLHSAQVKSTNIKQILEKALDEASLGVLLADKYRKITFANNGFSRLTGYSEADLLGNSCSILQGKKTDSAVTEKIRKLLDAGQSFSGPILNYRKDGTTFWNNVLIDPLRNEKQELYGFFAIQRDITDLMRTHLKLEEFKATLDQTLDCIFIIEGSDHRIVYANEGARQQVGFTESELMNLTPLEINPTFTKESLELALQPLRDGTQQSLNFETTHRHKDGRDIPVEMFVQMVRTDAEFRYISVARDISERKRFEEELRFAHKRFQALVEKSSDLTLIFDREGIIQFVNPASGEILGYEPEEMTGRPQREFVHPEDLEMSKRDFELQLLIPGGSMKAEVRIRDKSGDFRILEAISTNLLDVPAISGFVVNCRDITDRKVAAAAREKSETQYRRIVETANEGIWTIDKDNLTDFANERMGEIIGYSVEEIIGRSLFDFMDDEGIKIANDNLERRRNGIAEQHDFKFVHKNGNNVWTSISTNPLLNPDGSYQGSLAMVSDITERKIAEREIISANDQLNATLDAIPDLLFEMGLDGIYLNYLGQQSDLLAVPPEVFIGKSVREVLTAEAAEVAISALAESNEKGFSRGKQMVLSLPQGTRWFELSVSKKSTRDGIEPRFIVLSRDITERKLAEDEIRENERQLTALISNLPGYVYRAKLDEDYTPLFISENVKTVTGYEQSEYLVEKTISCGDEVHPDDVDRIWKIVEAAIAQKSQYECEYRLFTKSGEMKWVWERGQGYFNSDGEIQFIEGFVTDISQRTKLREDLERNERHLQTIIETEPECLKLIGRNGELIEMNSAGLTMLEADSLEEAKVKPLLDYVLPQYREEFLNLTKRVLIGETGILEFEIEGLKGTRRWLETHAAPMRNERGVITSLLGVTRDITERKESEAERLRSQTRMVEAQKMEAIGQLAGGIAHDFNNLLTVIIGRAHLSLMKLTGNDPVSDGLNEILSASESAASLTKQLLAFSRQDIVSPVVLNVNDLISDLHKMITSVIREDIHLRFFPSMESASILIGRIQIEQIILNLTINARDAMPYGGELLIKLQTVEIDESDTPEFMNLTPGSYVTLTLADTGVGMDEETRLRIFEPFFTTKEKGRGTGLGLSTVYGIVAQFGGEIVVESAIGKGTTFVVYLPRVKNEVKQPDPDLVPIFPGTETILIVDDNQALIEVVKNILETSGYTVLKATSGEEAISILTKYEKPVDLLLTDVLMPEMNGKDLADKIVEIRPEIKVIFTSGHTAEEILLRDILQNKVHFIAKPYMVRDLIQKMQEVLNRPAADSEDASEIRV